ncbi:non-specific lipid transfer protein GPI-anchored 5 [Capsicum chacoense]|uniref:non-specific lipid transfer protein GPI-anchored 5 n=1 Tax=Capsicum annuum TaxID=4072 RepID=UPI0007BF975E|nr:non-specific lipid transfer protein GPI-anchored 5 [Capsicum annuum]KAF3651276.1 putative major pollen allergen Ole e 6-like [Capsicum annuum]
MKMLTSAVFVVLAIIAIQVSGQSDDCQQVIVGLAPCLDYIQGNATKPSSGCCTQLATIVKNQPQCLCQVVNGGSASSMGINVNQTQAMALPKACNVQTPSVNICKATTPSGSPGSPSTPSGGSKGEPSGNSGYRVKLPYSLLFTLVVAASFATVFTI